MLSSERLHSACLDIWNWILNPVSIDSEAYYTQ